MDKIIEKNKKENFGSEIEEEYSGRDMNDFKYLISDSGRCYLLEDIKDMPYEYISKVKELMDEFRQVVTGKQKKLSYSGAKFSEIKGDQIRIVYKKVDNNTYLFYGAFIKKDDWKYRVDFNKVISRNGNVCEDSSLVESQIEEYIKNNQRKWSR